MSLAESAPISAHIAGSTPRLPLEPSAGTTPRLSEPAQITPATTDKSSKKRSSFFSLSKKKQSEAPATQSPPGSVAAGSPTLSRDSSKISTTATRSATSPSRQNPNDMSFSTYPSSPTRGLSSSPRLSSPAGSQIFERDVQDSVILPTSPAIPSHIQTENHIPPVLNASSEAITDRHLDPDSVEILTHASHLPASLAVTGAIPPPQPQHQSFDQWAEEFVSFADRDLNRDDVSSFSPLDCSVDIRRLSFISFADVVQAEQHHGASPNKRSSIHLAGLTSIRAPSPMRSPVSSQGPGTSPPTSKSGSIKGLEMSPARKPIGSPAGTLHGASAGSEINVETMSQALRRTGSGDLSGSKSYPTSPIEGPGSR